MSGLIIFPSFWNTAFADSQHTTHASNVTVANGTFSSVSQTPTHSTPNLTTNKNLNLTNTTGNVSNHRRRSPVYCCYQLGFTPGRKNCCAVFLRDDDFCDPLPLQLPSCRRPRWPRLRSTPNNHPTRQMLPPMVGVVFLDTYNRNLFG